MPRFLLLLPLAAAWLTWWSAEKVRENRSLRQGDLVALLSETEMPGLNPFLPVTEAERQLVEIIHAPLIKVGAGGRIEPVLASEWRWLKRVTVWFGTPGEALNAGARLLEVRGSLWSGWRLENAETEGMALRLTFSDPMFGDVRGALRVAKARVVLVTIIRIEAPRHAREVRAALVAKPEFGNAVQRLWFDGDGAFEIAVAGVPADYSRHLRRHLEQSLPGEDEVKVMVQTQQTTLEEPVLEFSLRADAIWHDGRRVSARDIKATFEALMEARVPVPEVESLRVVRALEVMAPNRVHAVFWRHRGPAMCAWVDLPILPEEWLKSHPLQPGDQAFRESMPLGAGPCVVEHRDYRQLVLRSARQEMSARGHRLTLVTNLSAFSTQLGYSTKALDLFWPGAISVPETSQGEMLVQRPSPPRESVRVRFNTKQPPLDDHRVRQALSLATDRQALAMQTLRGQGTVHHGLFAPGLWLSANAQAPEVDAAQSETLLGESGWLRGINGMLAKPGGSLVLKLLVPQGDPVLALIAADLRLQWLKLGVQANVMVVASPRLERMLAERVFDVVLERMPLHPSWDLWSQWHSDEPGNVTGVADRQIDLLLEALSHEFDPDEAGKRCRELEGLILAEHAVLPLVTLHERTLMRRSLNDSDSYELPWTLRDLMAGSKQ